jgi:FtsH-binding integral membrane protein
MVSFACVTSNPNLVLIAALMTLGITAALTLYALTTKTDFTMHGGLFFVIGMGLCLFALFASLFGGMCPILHIFFCCVSVILYGMYLIYDIQLLVGGKELELSLDDYVIASIQIYLDIILIFLNIL